MVGKSPCIPESPTGLSPGSQRIIIIENYINAVGIYILFTLYIQ